MRLKDFPRPKNNNRRGVHWSASVYHPTGAALDFWISELQEMNIKWVKLLDDSGGSSLGLCERLLAADIMPIVRLYRLDPNPGRLGGRETGTLRSLIAAGVRYLETNNEPNLPAEWKDGHRPENWLDIVLENFIRDADTIIEMGGLPALPAMGVGSHALPVEKIVDKGRGDLFENGAWIAIHNYTLNHPLDYPYDPVNQEGKPVTQEEYDRLGSWAWEGVPRELINEWRVADKNPGHTLKDDPTGFLGFELVRQQAVSALGFEVPIISTEGGPVMGWKDDRRYPRIDPATHAEWVVATNDFMQGRRKINGQTCPDSYFAMCFWLLGNYRFGFMAPSWESQSWYTDWWNHEFGLSGALPVVAAVKAMPSVAVDQANQATIAGKLLRSDTNQPLPDLTVNLLRGAADDGPAQIFASTTSGTDGSFRFERLAPGNYDLEAPPWGVLRRGVLATPEPAEPLTILLTGGQSSTLSGAVHDQAGVGVAEFPVTLGLEDVLLQEGKTDSDGGFQFTGLHLGNYTITVPGITVAGIALDGWVAKKLHLTTGRVTGHRYVVTKQQLLAEDEPNGDHAFFGIVTDAAGAPLNGIKLQMAWQNAEPDMVFPTTTTGKDPYRPAGYYRFVHTPGIFSIQVVQQDWPSDVAADLDTATAPGREGQPVSYQIDFQRQAVTGQARIDGLMPGGIPGQALQLIGADDAQTASLAENGSFAFPNLAPGFYQLELAGIGVIAQDIRLEAGGLHKLFFPMASTLQGRVLAPTDGLAAVLHAPDAWGWTRQLPLALDGSFAFEALPPGNYRLEVAGRIVPDIKLNGENTLQLAAIDLAAGQRGVLSGRVADGAGRPQPDVAVVLRLDDEYLGQTKTAADGVYRFANLSAGIYSLEVTGLGEVAGGIVLDGNREHVVDVLWSGPGPRGILQGRVLGANGAPQPDLAVRLLRDGDEVNSTRTDIAGNFRFVELAGGDYQLVTGRDEPVVAQIHLAEDATVTHEFILPPGPGKPLATYLLFAPPSDGAPGREGANTEIRLALALATEYLLRTGTSAGFTVAEAAHANEVTIVGETLPESVEIGLRAAGCEVRRLHGDGYALAAVFDELIANLGEG